VERDEKLSKETLSINSSFWVLEPFLIILANIDPLSKPWLNSGFGRVFLSKNKEAPSIPEF
jgi:hypothetical protein